MASGAAGNAQPLVRVPGPATAVAGGSAQLFAIAADPDRDALGYSWEVRSGGDCVSALTESDQPIAAISLDGGCADQSVALTVTVSDGRGGNASADTRVEILAP